MIETTEYSVSINLLDELLFDDFLDMKTSLNEPTGDFFYDPWVIKSEYKNTVWGKILKSLGIEIGQARIIVLDTEKCYTKHSDIDDRYHLNLHGDEGYLIDLESYEMHHLKKDGIWYYMDAGILHTAASFGQETRVQLVVRKLLDRSILKNPQFLEIELGGKNPRYVFDNTLSSWLNRANKNGYINNFTVTDKGCSFYIEFDQLSSLKEIIPQNFQLHHL